MPKTFEKSGVYHSELVSVGEIDITITSAAPEKSKFEGKPPYIAFKCQGEEHRYTVENEHCGEALTGLKGQTVTIVASGSRDDARIKVLGGGARTERQPERRTEEPHRVARRPEPSSDDPPPRKTKEERAAEEHKEFTKAKVFGARCATLYRIAWKHADLIAADTIGEEAALEDVRAIATTLYIEMKSMTDITRLPVAWSADAPKETDADRQKRERDEQIRREEEEAEARRRKTQEHADLDAPEDDIPF